MRSPQSKRAMAGAIRKLAKVYFEASGIPVPENHAGELWRLIPWHRITAGGVDMLMAATTGSPSYRSLQLAALRGIARTGFRHGVIPGDVFTAITQTEKVRGRRETAGRDLHQWEIDALINACQNGRPINVRDEALIRLAAAIGARRAELVAIRVEDLKSLSTEKGPAIQGRILGKGDKERIFYAYNETRLALRRWLELRGESPGPVFCRVSQENEILTDKGMSTTAAHQMLQRRAKAAGLEEKLSWHDFRRTLTGDLLDAGVDIATVAHILGHASVQTTQRYDRRDDRAMMEAMSKRR